MFFPPKGLPIFITSFLLSLYKKSRWVFFYTCLLLAYHFKGAFFLVVILGKNINPMRTARLRGVLNLPNVWSKETVEHFFSVIDNPRDMAIFMNIYGSGLRISEICRLKVEDIDSKNMRIFIRQGKFNRDRYTILSQRGLEALRRYWRIFKPSSPEHYLFPGRWNCVALRELTR